MGKGHRHNNIDQAKLSQLLEILHRRGSLAQEIVASMSKSWLSNSQGKELKAMTQTLNKLVTH